MPQVKIITKAAYDALQSANVEEADQLRNIVGPGTYRIFLTSLEGVSAEMMVPEVPTLSAVRVGGFQSTAAPGYTSTFNIDTSGLVAGDVLYFCYGVQAYATAATVNDISATKISTDLTPSGAGRASAFSYILRSADIATSIAVQMTIPTNSNAHIFDCWAVSGAVLTDVKVAQQEVIDPVTISPVASTTPNIAIVWTLGTWDEPATFDGADTIEINDSLPTATTRAMAVAVAEDVPVGPHAITFTPGAAGSLGMVAVMLEVAQ